MLLEVLLPYCRKIPSDCIGHSLSGPGAPGLPTIQKPQLFSQLGIGPVIPTDKIRGQDPQAGGVHPSGGSRGGNEGSAVLLGQGGQDLEMGTQTG
jgi:hypothetical protein